VIPDNNGDMNTRLVEEKEINSRIRKSCEDIQKICNAGDVFSLSGIHRDPVQTLLMRRGFNGDGLITPMIESAAIQAEIKSAGAGEIFLKIFSNSMVDEISRKSVGASTDDEWEKIQYKILKYSIPARKRDLSRIFRAGSQTYQRIIANIFDTICANDNVLIRKSAQSKTKVSREQGYSFFNLEIDQRFFLKGSWTRKNVRTLIIDGIIERVSEIHLFLDEISKSKTPAVIFCIDCLPEVMETITKNYSLGSLDTILVKVPVSEFHVNTLADLGVIFGVSPVTAARGETISTGISNQVSFADRITISRRQTSIERIQSRTDVLSHVSNLRKRVEMNIDLTPVLESRIKSLSSSTTRVDVGIVDQKTDPGIVESLDRTFRSLPKIFKAGFIEKSDFKEFSSSKICLLFSKNNVVSAEMAFQAIKIFLSTRSAIRSTAAGIESI